MKLLTAVGRIPTLLLINTFPSLGFPQYVTNHHPAWSLILTPSPFLLLQHFITSQHIQNDCCWLDVCQVVDVGVDVDVGVIVSHISGWSEER
ncbi:hypothetical protein Pcinc_035902 [Petrolisthes cinctipes]|uniref:Uncharacterized protein n=1 Tax=Petrolisthes cinctipes TaxID=88211 RepID=A0AAE1BW00_PETCI|nr:hypothetical protein Pcinc_035902 [Petrolisthes cinctipes]